MSFPIKRLTPLAVIVVLAALVVYALNHRANSAAPDGLIFANGRLESDRIAVASKVPGRVAEMFKQEGDAVKAGDMLARLDDSQIRPKVEQAQAAVAALTAQLQAKREEVAVARKEAPLGVAASQAQRQRAAAQAEQTRRDANRLSNLKKEGAIDAYRAEQAELAAVAAATQLDQAERQLSQSKLAFEKVAAAQTGLGALEAQLAAARAALAEAQAALDETVVKAPSNGVIAIRAREPGEVVGAGGTLFELYDPNQLFLRAYVPETDIGRLKLGLAARVWVDAYPDRAFEARLTNIANRAEFTPKEVQTRNERAKQVFGIKLLLKAQPDARLAPGLPGDAAIRYNDSTPWQAPKS